MNTYFKIRVSIKLTTSCLPLAESLESSFCFLGQHGEKFFLDDSCCAAIIDSYFGYRISEGFRILLGNHTRNFEKLGGIIQKRRLFHNRFRTPYCRNWILDFDGLSNRRWQLKYLLTDLNRTCTSQIKSTEFAISIRGILLNDDIE